MALEVLPERFLCEEGGRDESPPARRRREKKASRELKIDAFADDARRARRLRFSENRSLRARRANGVCGSLVCLL